MSVSRKRYQEGYAVKYDLQTTVTVNGKKIYSKTAKGQYTDISQVKVIVTDVDKKDKQMELMVIEGDIAGGTNYADWSSDMEHIYYYQYANGKAKRRQDLAPLFKKIFNNPVSLHGIKNNSYLTINGKNEIYARVCEVVQKNQYGDNECLHIQAGLVLKKGSFKQLSSRQYKVVDIGGAEDITVTVKKNLTAKTQAGGKKKAFAVKKGEKISLGSKYCVKGRKTYLKIRNKKGKWGYIELKKGYLNFDGIMHV